VRQRTFHKLTLPDFLHSIDLLLLLLNHKAFKSSRHVAGTSVITLASLKSPVQDHQCGSVVGI